MLGPAYDLLPTPPVAFDPADHWTSRCHVHVKKNPYPKKKVLKTSSNLKEQEKILFNVGTLLILFYMSVWLLRSKHHRKEFRRKGNQTLVAMLDYFKI